MEEGNKKTTTKEDDFNLLKMNPNSPFHDGLEMEFLDEFSDVHSVKTKEEEKETTEDIEEPVETKKEPVKKAEPKKEVKAETTTETEEEEETKETTTETEEETNGLHTFASWLNEQGVVELEEGKTVESEDDLKEVISTTINKGIEEYKSSHPEEVQKFIEFVDNGGNPRDFHKLYYEQRSWKDVDVSKEQNQELVIREAYKQMGWDDEDIESEITDKKDLGKLEPLAQKLHKKLIAGEEDSKMSLLEAQKEHQRKQQELAKKQWDEFKEDLFKREDVSGFKLTPKVKNDLWDFMTKVDKTGKTGLQKHNETNENAQILYAYLAMNNWDISKFEKQVKTKVTSELQKSLKNITDSRSKMKGGSDSFNDKKQTNNFSAFKTAITNNLI